MNKIILSILCILSLAATTPAQAAWYDWLKPSRWFSSINYPFASFYAWWNRDKLNPQSKAEAAQTIKTLQDSNQERAKNLIKAHAAITEDNLTIDRLQKLNQERAATIIKLYELLEAKGIKVNGNNLSIMHEIALEKQKAPVNEKQKNRTKLKEELESLQEIADETLAIANKKPERRYAVDNSSDRKKLKKKYKELKKRNAELEESKKKSDEQLNNIRQRVETLEKSDWEKEKVDLKSSLFSFLQSIGSTK